MKRHLNYARSLVGGALSIVFLAATLGAGGMTGVPGAPTLPISQINGWACAKQYRFIGNNKKALRFAVKQHLSETDKFFKCPIIKVKRQGLDVALTAAMCATDRIGDQSFAAEICEKYIVPNQKLALDDSHEYLSKDAIQAKIILIWERAGKTRKVVDACKAALIAKPKGNRADALRVKLASALIKLGYKSEAAAYLRQIRDDSSMAGAKSWLPGIAVNLKTVDAQRAGVGLEDMFTNMSEATLADVQEEAAREAASGFTIYSNVPASTPFKEHFSGGFTPSSNSTQLAVCTDTDIRVFVDNKLVLDTTGGMIQKKPFYVVPFAWKKDKLYHVNVDYLKSIAQVGTIGGSTLFAYNGGGDLTFPALTTSITGRGGTIKVKFSLTGTGPIPIISVTMKEKENADSVHTCPWREHGEGTPTTSGNTTTWEWDWDTVQGPFATHNGGHSVKVTAVWANGATLIEDSSVDIENLVITSVNPELLIWSGSGTVQLSATFTDSDCTNPTSTPHVHNVVSGNEPESITSQSSWSWSISGPQSTKAFYTCDVGASHLTNTGSFDYANYRSNHLVTYLAVQREEYDNSGNEKFTVNYTLADDKGRPASQADLYIYGPDQSQVGTKNLETSLGSHSTMVSVPKESMPTGTYVFIIKAKDNDGPEYRDHNNRWASESGYALPYAKIKIMYDGQDVTDETQDTIVGKRINLTADVEGTTPSAQFWTVPPKCLAGWTADNTRTYKINLTNLTSNTVDFFWHDGGDGRQVTYTATIDGAQFSASTTFNVKRPTYTITPVSGTVGVGNYWAEPGWWLYCGNPDSIPGIEFSSIVAEPQGFGSGGTRWVQVVNSALRRIRLSDGWYRSPEEDKCDIDGWPLTFTSDSPAQSLNAGELGDIEEATTNDSYSRYLMYMPAGTGNYWVPLAVVHWGWSGHCTWNGTSTRLT